MRFGAKDAFDAAMPVLMQRAYHFGGVDHLGGRIAGGHGHQNFALGHGHIHRAQIEERVTEGQHALAIVITHRARAADAHIAIHQDARHSVARIERMLPAGRRFGGLQRAAGGGSALRHGDAKLLEKRREIAQHVLIEAGENQRRFNRNHGRKLRREVLAHSRRNQLL